MEISEWIIYTVAEAIFVLVVVCLLLLFHAKGLNNLIASLQTRLAKAISDLNEKAEPSSVRQDRGEKPYGEQLTAHIHATEDFHASQANARPIDLDVAHDTPPQRLVAAMRYKFLKAERECLADDSGQVDWNLLAKHYRPLKPDFSDSDHSVDAPITPSNLSYDEQRAEIERFKRLFTTMEGQWQNAKGKAEHYYAQLLSVIGNSTDPEHLALKTMVEEQLNQLDQAPLTHSADATASASRDDLLHLKSVNQQQKNEIAKLQQQLANTNSDEERLGLTKDLERQLAQQLQFMRESEVCIDLLEKELQESSLRIAQLEADGTGGGSEQLIKDKHQLHQKIKQLENENEQLASLAEHSNTEQKRKIAQKDKELMTMKSKFTELVRRYKAVTEKVKTR